MTSRVSRKRVSSGQNLLDPNVEFPVLVSFEHPKKLPTYKSVIGVMRNLTLVENYQSIVAIGEVSKLIYAKYYHDSVFCISIQGIRRKLKLDWEIFKQGRKRLQENRSVTSAPIAKYKSEILDKIDKLYDVGCPNPASREICQTLWGISMSDNDQIYYEDQKTDRKMVCEKVITTMNNAYLYFFNVILLIIV